MTLDWPATFERTDAVCRTQTTRFEVGLDQTIDEPETRSRLIEDNTRRGPAGELEDISPDDLVPDGGQSADGSERPEWVHLGNPWCHSERYRCTACGRERSISNRSDRYQAAGEPDPCGCNSDTETDRGDGPRTDGGQPESGSECAQLFCDKGATHDFHDDMGTVTPVCDDHADQFPEEMLEPRSVDTESDAE